MALKIENPALNFISSAENKTPIEETQPTPKQDILAPAKKKDIKSERLNLLIKVSTKVKLQKFIEKEGYKSANDYINYLIESALIGEPEPTAAEIRNYKKEASNRKLK